MRARAASFAFRGVRCLRSGSSERGGGQSVHPQGDRDLSAVVEVVLDDVPDHPSARVGIGLAWLTFIRLIPCCRSPFGDRLVHRPPSSLESLDKIRAIPPSGIVAIPNGHTCELLATFSDVIGKPAGAGCNDVRDRFADRAQMRCGPQVKLRRRKWPYRADQERLVNVPRLVERHQRR
jgi:hypothetical protein